jgi:hypothetical protein
MGKIRPMWPILPMQLSNSLALDDFVSSMTLMSFDHAMNLLSGKLIRSPLKLKCQPNTTFNSSAADSASNLF